VGKEQNKISHLAAAGQRAAERSAQSNFIFSPTQWSPAAKQEPQPKKRFVNITLVIPD
jgi:hypothetical protein